MILLFLALRYAAFLLRMNSLEMDDRFPVYVLRFQHIKVLIGMTLVSHIVLEGWVDQHKP